MNERIVRITITIRILLPPAAQREEQERPDAQDSAA